MSVAPILFHRVPADMHGYTLTPLNQLKHIAPAAYQRQVAKYQGREHVMARIIPYLNCLWNDVLQFSAIHPAALRDALTEAGLQWTPQTWITLDPQQAGFNGDNAVIWHYPPRLPEGQGFYEDDCIRFDSSTLTALNTVSDATRSYYQLCRQRRENPLLFVHVPHVFFRGTLDIRSHTTIVV